MIRSVVVLLLLAISTGVEAQRTSSGCRTPPCSPPPTPTPPPNQPVTTYTITNAMLTAKSYNSTINTWGSSITTLTFSGVADPNTALIPDIMSKTPNVVTLYFSGADSTLTATTTLSFCVFAGWTKVVTLSIIDVTVVDDVCEVQAPQLKTVSVQGSEISYETLAKLSSSPAVQLFKVIGHPTGSEQYSFNSLINNLQLGGVTLSQTLLDSIVDLTLNTFVLDAGFVEAVDFSQFLEDLDDSALQTVKFSGFSTSAAHWEVISRKFEATTVFTVFATINTEADVQNVLVLDVVTELHVSPQSPAQVDGFYYPLATMASLIYIWVPGWAYQNDIAYFNANGIQVYLSYVEAPDIEEIGSTTGKEPTEETTGTTGEVVVETTGTTGEVVVETTGTTGEVVVETTGTTGEAEPETTGDVTTGTTGEVTTGEVTTGTTGVVTTGPVEPENTCEYNLQNTNSITLPNANGDITLATIKKGFNPIVQGCNGQNTEYWNGSAWTSSWTNANGQTQNQIGNLYATGNNLKVRTFQAHEAALKSTLKGKTARTWITCNNGQYGCVQYEITNP